MLIRAITSVLCAIMLYAVAPIVWGQSNTEPDSTIQVVPDFYNNPKIIDSASNVMGEADIRVDPHSGTLTIAHTDLYVPGAGGFDIQLTRYYHSLHPQAFNYYSPVGVGWSLHFGLIKTSRPGSMCNPVYNAHIADNPVYIAPDGSQRPLAIGVKAGAGGPSNVPDAEYFTYITQSFDVVYCKNFLDPDPSNDQLWMRTPDGRRYEFTKRFLDPLTDSPAIWYVNKIIDANGNYLDIEYQSSGVEGNSGQLIDYIEASDGRRVDFGYDSVSSKGPRLAYIEYAGKRWKYGYEDSEVNHEGWPQSDYFISSNLVSVTTPDNDKWEYAYNGFDDGISGGEGCIRNIENPYGGNISVSYEVEKVYQLDAFNYILNRRVTKLIEEGRNTYDYSYSRTSDGDTTTVSSDIGDTTYEFDGLRSVQDGEVWKIGVLRKKTFDPVSGPSSTVTYNYDRTPISSENEIRRERIGFDIPEDENYYHPILVSKTLELGGDVWSKSYNYGSTHVGVDDWYLFAPPNPEEIEESGPAGSRTMELSYRTESDKYLWNMFQGEKPSSGVYKYLLVRDSFGNVSEEHNKARSVSYTVDSVGNRTGAVTDTGESSSFSRYKLGVAERIVTPAGMVIDQGVDDFGRVESVSYQGRTKSIKRDVAGRIESITPIQGLKTTVSWSSNSAILRRGDLKHTYGFDQYGRVTSESISGPDIETINILRGFDEQDNVTSITINGSMVGYNYDGYGRLTSINDNGAIRTISYSGDKIIVTNEKEGMTTYRIRSYKDPFTYEYMGFEQDGGVFVDIDRNVMGDILRISSGGYERRYDYSNGYFYPASYLSPETGYSQFSYDEGGRLIGKFDYEGQEAKSLLRIKIMEYDDAGRLASETFSDSDEEIVNNYNYNLLDELISAESLLYKNDDMISSVVTDYEYEPDGALASRSVSVDDKKFDVYYGYDDYRSNNSITYPSGNAYQIENNPLGQAVFYEGFVNHAGYDYAGGLSNANFANGDVYSTERNQRRLLASMQVENANSGILHLVYSYDDAANVEGISDELAGGRDATGSYDDYSRLVHASSNGHAYGYVYDDVNNITSVSRDGVGHGYVYHENNRIKNTQWVEGKDYYYNLFGEIVQFGAMPEDGLEVGSDFFWESYDRYPDGSIKSIYKNKTDFSDPLYKVGNVYRYDHRGYMIKEQAKSSFLNDQVPEDIGGPIYKIYDEDGNIFYEYDAETGFKKEYHYLSGRLVGFVEDKYGCFDDPDGDGMPYCFEEKYGLNNHYDDASLDLDGDGLSNLDEYLASSDPGKPDTDFDGIPDYWEYHNGLDPTASNKGVDTDGDGFSDYQEYLGDYDPTIANLPRRIPGFALVGTANGIEVRWDKAISPEVKLYVGAAENELSLHGEVSADSTVLPYPSLPDKGYMAVASFNNEGETEKSSPRSFNESQSWASFSLPGSDSFITHLDQHGLMLAVDQGDYQLKAYISGMPADSMSLDSAINQEADYLPEHFQTGVLPNGDVVTMWVTQDPARKIYAARYCLQSNTFCEGGQLYQTYTRGNDGEYKSTIDELSVSLVGDQIVALWREDRASRVGERTKAMSFDGTFSAPTIVDLDDELPVWGRIGGLSVARGTGDSLWAARTLCCNETTDTEIYVTRWAPSSGWEEAVKVYSSTNSNGVRHDIQFVSNGRETPLLLFEDAGNAIIGLLRHRLNGWQVQAGVLKLSDSGYWPGEWSAVADSTHLYVVLEEGGKVTVNTSSLGGELFSFSEYPIEYSEFVESIVTRRTQGAPLLLLNGETISGIAELSPSGATVPGLLPVSGMEARFINAKDNAYFSVATNSGLDSKATVVRSQLPSLTPNVFGVIAQSPRGFTDMGPIRPGSDARVCASWVVNSQVEDVQVIQKPGPSFGLQAGGGACAFGKVPYLDYPGSADFEVAMSVNGERVGGQDSVDIPPFSPHLEIASDERVLEGQSIPLSLSIFHDDGEYYSGPVEVTWTQLSGPARSLLPAQLDGSRAVLWAPDVSQEATSTYQAEVYFPEADVSFATEHSVTIEDSGTTVILPPEIAVVVEPYSQYGYDMQRISISTDQASDLTMRFLGAWSMLQDGNEPETLPSGAEPETGFQYGYRGPFSVILEAGQEIEVTARAESINGGPVAYYSFRVVPPPVGPIEPEVTVEGPSTVTDGDEQIFTAITYANSAGTVYNGPVEYTWEQLAGPELGIGQGEDNNPLSIVMPEVSGALEAMLQVTAYLPDEGMAVTTQKTFSIVDDESSEGQAPEISWTVEPYSAYGYDLNRVAFDAGEATVHLKIYGSWTMLSDGNQPTEVPAGNEPEPDYKYQYVAPFSVLREAGKEMDITIRAQSPSSGLISYERVIVDQNGGTAAPVN